MRKIITLVMALFAITTFVVSVPAQVKPPTDAQVAEAGKAFEAGNTLMEQRKYSEALRLYKEALAVLPTEGAVLFNGGLAAYQTNDYPFAAELWKRLKEIDPQDWHVRAKLVQVHQALGKLNERDVERAELFELWKSGKNAELKQQVMYCREQFQVKDQKLMVFEHFELKGNRALRYVFSIMNKEEDGEEWRISLGSYDMTNSIWRETQKPKPAPDVRLFHLDGYFPNGHATYGMYSPEPSYDQIRAQVIQILDGKAKALSSSTFGTPKPKAEVPPKP